MLVIALRIALTLDVKIVWFGCQVAVCVKKRHKNAFFGCSWFQKFNLLHKLLICSAKTENIFKFVCPLWTKSSIMISGIKKIFYPLFGLKSQIMTLSQKLWKNYFLGHCSFMQLFHDVEKFRRKPKSLVKVKQRFWYAQHVCFILIFKCTRSSQSCKFGKILQCWKT